MNDKKTNGIILFLTAIFIIAEVTFNILEDGKAFFNSNLISLIGVMSAVFISYFVVQRLTDKRRKADAFDRMLLTIEQEVENTAKLFSEDKPEALLIQRSLANRIRYLKEAAEWDSIEKDMVYIESRFSDLRNAYGEYIDKSQRSTSQFNTMKRCATDIKDKCVHARLELYKV